MPEKSVITQMQRRPENPALDLLLKHRRKFLNFVRASVHDFDAEEIIQRASVKILWKAEILRDNARAEAWIYRILRNEVADYFRRLATQSKRIQELSDQALSSISNVNVAADSNPCPCAAQELAALRENYADALRALEMNQESVAAYADRKGVSANNVMVLLHRARKSLRTRLQSRCGSCAGPGCFTCTCSA
ncbi:MAG TPA: RNA polymerase sigma factor [Candidatus Eisenbacteria bacterium]|nr:RNA polymerase sigma factor [Candidatus Eisenbacteria bacterium]